MTPYQEITTTLYTMNPENNSSGDLSSETGDLLQLNGSEISPTSVLDSLKGLQKVLPPVPNLNDDSPPQTSGRKTVSFTEDPVVRPADTTLSEEEASQVWFSRDEIRSFRQRAIRDMKHFHQKRPESASRFFDLVKNIVQARESQELQEIAADRETHEIIERAEYIRGIEYLLHALLRKWKHHHVRSVLKCQGKARSNKERMLRAASVRTSRASKVVASLLAHSDMNLSRRAAMEELRKLDGLGDDRMEE